MNMPVLKDGSPWAGPIAGAVTGAVMSIVFGIFLSNYNSQITATASTQAETLRQQTAELREHDQDISNLKASRLADQEDKERTAKAIGDIQNTQSQILGALGNQKDATDESNRRLESLQKSFDGINDIIRPARAPSGH
jgi:chromosome segregation ATPase